MNVPIKMILLFWVLQTKSQQKFNLIVSSPIEFMNSLLFRLLSTETSKSIEISLTPSLSSFRLFSASSSQQCNVVSIFIEEPSFLLKCLLCVVFLNTEFYVPGGYY